MPKLKDSTCKINLNNVPGGGVPLTWLGMLVFIRCIQPNKEKLPFAKNKNLHFQPKKICEGFPPNSIADPNQSSLPGQERKGGAMYTLPFLSHAHAANIGHTMLMRTRDSSPQL